MGFFALKRAAALLIFILGLVLAGKGWHWAKDGFHILRIRSSFVVLQGTGPHPTSEITAALSQPYFYLGNGRQAYAFASQDGKYVLKLPRLNSYELSFWLRFCPFSFFNSQRKHSFDVKHKRLQSLLRSFQIAGEDLKEETGVLYVHLHPTQCFEPSIVLTDRLHRTYRLNLDRTPFVLQMKQTLMMPAVASALKRGKRNEAEKILEAFLNVVSRRASKGIFDKDAAFLNNFGFDGEKGYELDIGTFYRKDGWERKTGIETSFRESVSPVSRWLAGMDSEMQSWFDRRSDEILLKAVQI